MRRARGWHDRVSHGMRISSLERIDENGCDKGKEYLNELANGGDRDEYHAWTELIGESIDQYQASGCHRLS
jgi:hypothetical protein